MNQKVDRILFTLGIVVLYRFTTYITIPGLDLSVVSKFYADNSSILGIFNSMSGGAVSRMSIMALNLIPYVSASIIMQLLTAVIPEWKELKRDSYQRKKISRYSRMLALAISFVQSLGMAIGLENVKGLVISPGITFKFVTVVSVMSASLLIMWVSERITEKGIGNGSSIIIFTGILSNSIPGAIQFTQTYMKSSAAIFWTIITCLGAFIGVIVFCELLRYMIKVFFKRSALVSYNSAELASNVVPIKINPAGILPAMFADSMMVIPSLILRVLESRFGLTLGSYGPYLNLLIRSGMIMFFCLFCISIVMNPEDVSENLRSRRAYIDGIPEGKATASYFEDLLNKISVLGCLYTLFVTIGPDLLSLLLLAPGAGIFITGTSLLILIGTALEIYERIAPEPKLLREAV